MSERALGPGKLRTVVDSDGRAAFQLDYVTASGKRRRVIVGHDARTAERLRRKIIADRDLEVQGLGGERGLDLPVAQVVERYLAELALRAKPRVLTETTRELLRIVGDLQIRILRDITKARIVDWRHARARAGAANKTINNGVAVLASALNLAVELDQIIASPLAGLRALPVSAKHRVRLPRALTDSEMGALIRAAERYDKVRPHLIPRLPLMFFLLGTGARWSEAVAVRWADIDSKGGAVTLRSSTTKTEKTRVIPLDPCVLDALASLHAVERGRLGADPPADSPAFRSPEGARWTSDGRFNFRRYLRALMKAARIEYRDSSGRVVHIHAMRHTFATRLMHAKVPMNTAKDLMGHATTAMLADVYQHSTADDARRAIRSLVSLHTVAHPEPIDDESAG